MSRNVLSVVVCMVLLMFAVQPHAQEPALEFSADAVKMTADKQLDTARMYVGRHRVRKEYMQNGQQIVEIIDWGRGRAIQLMPEQKAYIESSTATQTTLPPRQAGGDTNPCLDMPGMQCRHLGQEMISGQRVDKWEMQGQRGGITERSLHWIDPQRQMPLRQVWPDGRLTELSLLGQEMLNGRLVEHWEQTLSLPDGVIQRASQWYDPELRIAVREELPGGLFRELRNIVVAVQPAQLFEIPAGYRRQVIPVPQGSGASEGTSAAPAPR